MIGMSQEQVRRLIRKPLVAAVFLGVAQLIVLLYIAYEITFLH